MARAVMACCLLTQLGEVICWEAGWGGVNSLGWGADSWSFRQSCSFSFSRPSVTPWKKRSAMDKLVKGRENIKGKMKRKGCTTFLPGLAWPLPSDTANTMEHSVPKDYSHSSSLVCGV